MTPSVGWLALGIALLVAAGCAPRADWIGGTLVTVDVTGVWKGRAFIGGTSGGTSGDFELALTQRGAKVTGDGQIRAQKFSVEGTVRGDVLTFNEPAGRLRGEAQVAGDEMFGDGRASVGTLGAGQQFPFRFTLAR